MYDERPEVVLVLERLENLTIQFGFEIDFALSAVLEP
jgi:hypothetical protein